MVPCPCCKGERMLTCYAPIGIGEVYFTEFECCHCMGKGFVASEVEEVIHGGVGAVGLSGDWPEN